MYGIAITVVSYNTCTFDSREAIRLQEVLAAAQSMMRLGLVRAEHQAGFRCLGMSVVIGSLSCWLWADSGQRLLDLHKHMATAYCSY